MYQTSKGGVPVKCPLRKARNFLNRLADTDAEPGEDLPDFFIIAVGVIAIFGISLVQENGIEVRKSLARQKLPVRWAVYACLVLSVVIFGAYGPGYDAVDFIYGQF